MGMAGRSTVSFEKPKGFKSRFRAFDSIRGAARNPSPGRAVMAKPRECLGSLEKERCINRLTIRSPDKGGYIKSPLDPLLQRFYVFF